MELSEQKVKELMIKIEIDDVTVSIFSFVFFFVNFFVFLRVARSLLTNLILYFRVSFIHS